MAKKTVQDPKVPPGDRLAFFRALRAMVLAAGDLSTAEVGARVGKSHQAIFKALVGPKMPSLELTTLIIDALDGDRDVILELWRRGVAEEREQPGPGRQGPEDVPAAQNRPTFSDAVPIPAGMYPQPATSTSTIPTSTDGRNGMHVSPAGSSAPTAYLVLEDEQQLPTEPMSRPALSVREIEVLVAWLAVDSKTEVSRRLYISLGTVNTHLERIRNKYAQAGRPAPTKAALMTRALQDRIIHVDEL